MSPELGVQNLLMWIQLLRNQLMKMSWLAMYFESERSFVFTARPCTRQKENDGGLVDGKMYTGHVDFATTTHVFDVTVWDQVAGAAKNVIRIPNSLREYSSLR